MFSCRCQPWCPSLTRCAWAATWCPPPASPTSQPTVCTQHLFYIPVLFYMYILYKFSLTYFRSSIKCKNIHKHIIQFISLTSTIHILKIHNSYHQNPKFISLKSKIYIIKIHNSYNQNPNCCFELVMQYITVTEICVLSLFTSLLNVH